MLQVNKKSRNIKIYQKLFGHFNYCSFFCKLQIIIFMEEKIILEDKIILNKDQDKLTRFAKAMGHPTRLIILLFLAKQDSCYFGEIHNELPIAKATVSQHLKELKNAGLIQGETKPPKVMYCINKKNWKLAKSYFEDFFLELKDNNNSL